METISIKINHDIVKACEEKKGVLLTGLDLSAVFNTVDHSIYHGPGKQVRYQGLALEWFKNYLRNRSVHVLAGNSVSEILSIPFSVSQGLYVGPVLYKI